MNKILLALILWLFSGCGDLFDNKDHYFPLDDKYKINFHVGDTLVYRNQFGQIFQLKITEIKKDQRATSRKQDGKHPFNIRERQTVTYDSLVPNPIPSARKRVISTTQPDGQVTWQDLLYGRIGVNDTFLPSKEINNVSFTSVHQLSAENIAAARDGDIVTWYYNYEFGFVGFELKNNQTFGLIP